MSIMKTKSTVFTKRQHYFDSSKKLKHENRESINLKGEKIGPKLSVLSLILLWFLIYYNRMWNPVSSPPLTKQRVCFDMIENRLE